MFFALGISIVGTRTDDGVGNIVMRRLDGNLNILFPDRCINLTEGNVVV